MNTTFLMIAASYLLGSLPTSALVGRLRGIDLRKEGSGNLGFTNALRVLGWRYAVPVLAIDVAKGAVPVLFIAPALASGSPLGAEWAALAAGLAAIAGHVWSVFTGFKGGKGIATTCGVFAALAPLATVASVAVWLVLVLSTRYVSVGSVVASIVLPLAVALESTMRGKERPAHLIILAVIVAVLVVVKHRGNLRRLAAGTENRFGRGAARGE